MSEAFFICETDVAYTERDGCTLRWDVYRPIGERAKRPAALLLHGGGFETGHRSHLAEAARELARHGYVAIAAQYRLISEAPWPAQLTDVYAALCEIHRSALGLSIDPDQIFVIGFSAGAQLAIMLAGGGLKRIGSPPSRTPAGTLTVAGIAALYPVARLGERQRVALRIPLDQMETLNRMDPINFSAGLPPTVLFHGTDDQYAPYRNSLELHHAISAANGVADLHLLAGLPHGFFRLPNICPGVIGEIANFFGRTVVHRASFDEAKSGFVRAFDAAMRGSA